MRVHLRLRASRLWLAAFAHFMDRALDRSEVVIETDEGITELPGGPRILYKGPTLRCVLCDGVLLKDPHEIWHVQALLDERQMAEVRAHRCAEGLP